MNTKKKMGLKKVVVNNIFSFQVSLDIIRNDEDPEPQNMEEYQHKNDSPK